MTIPIEPRVDVKPFEHVARRAEATYERVIAASVERIWENVLDWEHLPHLHSQSFTSVEMLGSDPDGWHGVVGIPGGVAEIDVRIDRAALRYSTRTVAGFGAGAEILTTLVPRSPQATAIRVEFHLPWAPEGAGEAIGESYRSVYQVLWDQDEEMMQGRQRVVDAAGARQAAAGAVDLGSMRELAARLPLDVPLGDRTYRVVSVDGRLVAFDTFCPHLGGPLAGPACDPASPPGAAAGAGAAAPGACVAVCPWHGYRFDVASGASADGRRLRLRPQARVEVSACDGLVTLRPPGA